MNYNVAHINNGQQQEIYMTWIGCSWNIIIYTMMQLDNGDCLIKIIESWFKYNNYKLLNKI
jgi:hypothetical protein